MAYTNVWNSSTPLGTAAANTIDDIFRSMKVDIQERFIDIFGMPNFTADPLRPYAFKFTDAQDGVINLGDNGGTPRALIIKNKTGATGYFSFDSVRFDIIGSLDIRVNTNKFIVLGASGNTTIAGTLGVTGAITGALTGNASTATALQTARNINGVSFNGTADITVTAAAGTLTGATLAAGVTGSSLTSLGTIATGVWQGTAVGAVYGGTAQTSWAKGDLLYASAANTLSKLAIGSNGYFLAVSTDVPAWVPTAKPDSNRCEVTNSATQTLTTAVEDTLDWDTESYDIGGFHPVGSDAQLTIPSGGNTNQYIIEVQVRWAAAGAATGYREVRLMKNTGGGMTVVASVRAPGSTDIMEQRLVWVENDPAVGAEYEVRATQTSGGNLDISAGVANTYFKITHI